MTNEPPIQGTAVDRSPLGIAVDGLDLGARPTGIGRYAGQLIRALVELGPDDRFFLALPREGTLPGSAGRAATVEITVTPHSPVLDLSRIWWNEIALRRWLRRTRPDLFFQPDFFLPAHSLPCPAVVTVHDLSFRLLPRTKSARFRRYLDLAVRRAVSRADGILVHARATADDLVRLYGADPEMIRAVAPAPADEIPDAERADQRPPDSGLVPGGEFFLHLSNFDPRKNVPGILRAFARLHGERPRLTLVLAGDGPEKAAVERLARRLGVYEACSFPGWVADRDLRAFFRGARAFLFPSLLEGYGLPVVEAMAHGTPVVTSGSGALAEAGGGAALTVDPRSEEELAQAMGRLCDEPELRQSLIAAGRERVEKLSWHRTASAVRDFFAEVVAR